MGITGKDIGGFFSGLAGGVNTGLQRLYQERMRDKESQRILDRWNVEENYRLALARQAKQDAENKRNTAVQEATGYIGQLQNTTDPQQQQDLLSKVQSIAYSQPGLGGLYSDALKVYQGQRSKQAIVGLLKDPHNADLYSQLTPADRLKWDWQYKNAWTQPDLGAVPASQYSKEFDKPAFQGKYVITKTRHNRLTGENETTVGNTLYNPPKLKTGTNGPTDKQTTQIINGLAKQALTAKAMAYAGKKQLQESGLQTVADPNTGTVSLADKTKPASTDPNDPINRYNATLTSYTVKHDAWVNFAKGSMDQRANDWYGGLYQAIGSKTPSESTYFHNLAIAYKKKQLSPDDVYQLTELGRALYELTPAQAIELMKSLQLPQPESDSQGTGDNGQK